MAPVLVQVMFRLSPTSQVSAPFGAVRVTVPLMPKFASEVSFTEVSSIEVIFTRAWAVGASGTTHEYGELVAGVDAVITV